MLKGYKAPRNIQLSAWRSKHNKQGTTDVFKCENATVKRGTDNVFRGENPTRKVLLIHLHSELQKLSYD